MFLIIHLVQIILAEIRKLQISISSRRHQFTFNQNAANTARKQPIISGVVF